MTDRKAPNVVRIAEIDSAVLALRFAEMATGYRAPKGVTAREALQNVRNQIKAQNEGDERQAMLEALDMWQSMANFAIAHVLEQLENAESVH